MGHSDDNAFPVWNFRCVHEIENEKRERVERMGVIPAFDEDMNNLAAGYGKIVADGRAWLATLSQSSDEDPGSSLGITAEAREFFKTLSDVCDRESPLPEISAFPTSVSIISSNSRYTSSQSSVHDPSVPDKHAMAFWKLHNNGSPATLTFSYSWH